MGNFQRSNVNWGHEQKRDVWSSAFRRQRVVRFEASRFANNRPAEAGTTCKVRVKFWMGIETRDSLHIEW